MSAAHRIRLTGRLLHPPPAFRGGVGLPFRDGTILVPRGITPRCPMGRSGNPSRRPTPEQLDAARGRAIPDLLADRLRVVFVGINPGLYSGAVGHHFARPGNRFWKALHGSGFTDRVWSPFEDRGLPAVGIGITNLVDRTTASAAELARAEPRAVRDAL